jgi:hypothetical protein
VVANHDQNLPYLYTGSLVVLLEREDELPCVERNARSASLWRLGPDRSIVSSRRENWAVAR